MTFKRTVKSTPAADELLAAAFLDGTLASASRTSFVVIEDCHAQSGLFLLREKLSRAVRSRRRTLLVSFAHDPRRLIRSLGTDGRVQTLDYSLPRSGRHSKEEAEEILSLTRSAVGARTEQSVTVLIDSITFFANRSSTTSAFRLIRSILALLRDKDELVVLHSPHLQGPSTSTDLQLTEFLRSSTLSPSLLLLRLHPSALLEHVLSAYNLQPPLPSTSDRAGTDYDLRTWTILHELEATGPANPHHELRDDEESLCPLAEAFSDGRVGRCVVEWTARNVAGASNKSSAALAPKATPKTSRRGAQTGSVEASVVRGFEGLRRVVHDGVAGVEVVAVQQVLELASRRPKESAITPPPTSDSMPGLTFNLSLTDRQRADREAVDLPYLPERGEDGIARQAPGAMYDGSFGTENPGGQILYQPESGDDFDDEEDED